MVKQKFTCPCSNVTVDLENDNGLGPVSSSCLTELLEDNVEDVNGLSALIQESFMNQYSCGISKVGEVFNQSQWVDIFIKIKYPLLMGSLMKKNTDKQHSITINKCLVCDVVSHCTVILKQSNITNETEENSSEKKGFLENKHNSDLTSSHSSILSRKVHNQDSFCLGLFVNTKEMILNLDNDNMVKSDNFSNVYDLLLNDKKQKKLNPVLSGLVYKINEVPIFEQRRFLSNIDEKYRLVSKHTEQQEILRKKFENLVNSLLNDDLNSNKNNISGSLATDTISAVTQMTNPIHSQSKSNKKNRKKGDESVLSSSVFEIEIDESDNSNDEDSDHESQGSGEESLDKIEQPQQKLIERKLNSNVAEIGILGGDVLKTNRVNFSKPNPFTNSRNDLNANQYSCSLPRDIPVMSHRLNSTSKNQQQKDDVNNENYYNPQMYAPHITNSYKPNSAYLNQDIFANNEFDDDDIFGNNNNNDSADDNFNIEEDDATNMGKAISRMASSIVIKDGRELFGGVPSRRVPINSISKSCFE